jgi:carbonic anhydrase
MADDSTDVADGRGRRSFLGLGLAGLATVLAGCESSPAPGATSSSSGSKLPAQSLLAEPSVSSPDDAWSRLQTGNQRFAGGAARHPDESAGLRQTLAGGQHPFAIVFSCVDSRVPPELVFDQGLGDLFVIRSAGHVLDHAVLGSLQYGVAELKIPLLLVLGHEKCGAVKATVEAVEKHSAASGTDIDALVTAIRPAVLKAQEKHPADLIDASVRANTVAVAADLGTKPIIGAAVSAGKLKIVGARYDLDTGLAEALMS